MGAALVSQGQTLDGTYHLHRLVGEGGMGVVYEATHARLAGRYAIKVLLPSAADPEVRARFDREARITSSLQHPNIVQVIDHNSTADGTSYLVMEFLSGESLAARLARDGRLAAPGSSTSSSRSPPGSRRPTPAASSTATSSPTTSTWCRSKGGRRS